MVYLPTCTMKTSTIHVGKHTIPMGSYGLGQNTKSLSHASILIFPLAVAKKAQAFPEEKGHQDGLTWEGSINGFCLGVATSISGVMGPYL